MNKCFLVSRIENDIDFKFILNGEHFSITRFTVKLLNDSLLEIISYDETADFCYRFLNSKDIVYIEGYLKVENGKVKMVSDFIFKLKDGESDLYSYRDYKI